MASTKSFFLAFALSVAVLADYASSWVESARPVLPVANYTVRNSYEFGARKPGDRLAANVEYVEAQSGGQPREFYKNINLGFGQLITSISANDHCCTVTKVSIFSGGPGHNSVVLRFQSPNNVLAFDVQVYAIDK